MKQLLLFLLLCTLTLSTHAQAPDWQTALVAGQPAGGLSIGQATATDAVGNVYITGNFIGTITLGAFSLTSTTAASDDIFVAKWSPVSQSFVWAQQAGGTGADGVYAIAVNGANVYLTGSFRSATATFGATTLTNSGAGLDETFVAKLTDAGSSASFTWALRAGSSLFDYGQALAVNGNSIYVVGRFTVDRTPADFGATTLTNAGSFDIFIAKITDAGNTASFSWAQRAGGTDSDIAYSVAVSGASLYVTGIFKSAAFPVGNTTLATAGGFDVFVTKLTDTGTTANFVWAQRAGGTTDDNAYGVAVSGANVYAVGTFTGSAATFGSTTLSSAGNSDIFVTKLADTGAAGNFVWTQQAGGTGNDVAYAVAANGSSLYVAGWFYSATALFGATALVNANAAKNDVFVAKLTDSGATASFTWAQRGGGTDYEGAFSIALSGTRIYLAGYAYPPTTFGSQATTGNTGVQSMFLASLTDSAPLATTTATALAEVSIYPNPVHVSAIIKIPTVAGAEHITLTLSNALGQVARTQVANLLATGGAYELNLTGFTKGLYMLQIQANATTVVRRISIE